MEEREWLEENEPFIYGADNNAPPLRFVDDDEIYKGVVVDFINSLSLELGVEINQQPYAWNEALYKLEIGETDIADMFHSEEREEKYYFTDPIYNLRTVLLTKTDNDSIQNINHISGSYIGMQKEDYAVNYVKNNVEGSFDYELTENVEEAIELLLNGEIEAVVGDEPVVSYFVSKLGAEDELQIQNPPLYERHTRLAVPKENEEFISILNKGIFEIQRKGILDDIQQKWFGLSASITYTDFPQTIYITFIVLSVIILFSFLLFYYWNYSLQYQVKQRTNKLRTIIDGITSYMIVINSDEYIEDINKSILDDYNYDRDRLIGLTFNNFFELLGINYEKDLIIEAVKKSKQKTFKLNNKDRVLQFNLYPLEGNSKNKKRALLLIEDITDKLINEKKLLQANKMSAIGQLSAGVAHEIRNPLGLIRNYLYLIKHDIDQKDSKIINKAESSIDKISNIINNMLNFSRISNSEKKWFNLYNFINEVFNLHRKNLKDENIDYKIVGDKKLNVYLNKDRLEHILINLISNSIDAFEDKVKDNLITVKYKKKDKLEILFLDNGKGIKEENIDNIFNPFYTTKDPGEGTGLGLYVVYNEIKKSKGEIMVNSKLSYGTEFKISLITKTRRDNYE